MFFMDSSSKKMVFVNVPHAKTVNLLLSDVKGVCISVHKLVMSKEIKEVENNYAIAQKRLYDTKKYLETLLTGGKINYLPKEEVVNALQFDVFPLSNPAQRKFVESLMADFDIISKEIDEIYQFKKLPRLNKKETVIKEKLANYDSTMSLIEKKLYKLLSDMDNEWKSFSDYMSLRIKNAITLMTAVVIFALFLYFVFGTFISNALKKPITEIVNQIKALSTGEIDLTKKLEVLSKDELGELSIEFNRLMDTISHISQFKKIAEEDDTLEDVYNRLGKIFKEELGLKDVIIYEVSNSKKI